MNKNKTKGALRVELLDGALSESGLCPFHAGDAPLVNELCEIIGILHRRLESTYGPMTAEEIREVVQKSTDWTGGAKCV